MLNPNVNPDPNADDPTANPNADDPTANPNAGDEQQAMTTRQMIDRLVGARGGNEEGITSEQRFQIEQETRNFIADVGEEFRDQFPEATNLQRQQFIEGMMSVDAGMILQAIAEAVKTTQEKEDTGDGSPKPLKVQGGGSGRANEQMPKTLDEAVLNIANSFG